MPKTVARGKLPRALFRKQPASILFRGKRYYHYGWEWNMRDAKIVARQAMRLGYKVRLMREKQSPGIGIYTSPKKGSL